MHPILFRIGNFTFYTYGVFVFLAFITVLWMAYKESKAFNLSPSFIIDLGLVIIIGGLAGGKLAYFLINPQELLPSLLHPGYWRGGFVFLGGLSSGFLSGFFFIRKKGEDIKRVSYFLTPYIPLGQAIGRLGCFFNGCCFGRPTSLPWGMVFPLSSPAGYHYGSLPLHPTQLYSCLFNLFLFLLLWKWRRKRKFLWSLFPLYLAIYLTFRGIMEFLRGDVILLFPGITLLHLLIIPGYILSFWWWRRWRI